MIIRDKIKKKLNNPIKTAKLMYTILRSENIIDQKKEHFWSIGLNSSLRIEYIELVSLGTLTDTVVTPRETFRLAIMKAVDSLILCHNHPSDNLIFSEDDISTTKKMIKAGKVIGITVLDHVLIGDVHNPEYEFLSYRKEITRNKGR